MSILSSASSSPWPKISVVTANLNQGAFLEETIHSVLNQGYPNLEYILIDGGSTDNSCEIIDSYQAHFAYHCSESDKGHYNAVNKGFSHATGEIMAFLNSDDKYFPGALHTVAEIFTIFSQIQWITSLNPGILDAVGRCISVQSRPGFSIEAFLDGRYCIGGKFGFIQQESTFWRRSLWQKIGCQIHERFSHAGDFALWSDFYLNAPLYGVSIPLAGFRLRDGQRSEDKEKYDIECKKILQEARSNSHWSPNLLRECLLKLRIFNFPLIQRLARKVVGYSSDRVVRHSPASPNATWVIERHNFP